jgi:hypothetical protein
LALSNRPGASALIFQSHRLGESIASTLTRPFLRLAEFLLTATCRSRAVIESTRDISDIGDMESSDYSQTAVSMMQPSIQPLESSQLEPSPDPSFRSRPGSESPGRASTPQSGASDEDAEGEADDDFNASPSPVSHTAPSSRASSEESRGVKRKAGGDDLAAASREAPDLYGLRRTVRVSLAGVRTGR